MQRRYFFVKHFFLFLFVSCGLCLVIVGGLHQLLGNGIDTANSSQTAFPEGQYYRILKVSLHNLYRVLFVTRVMVLHPQRN